MTGVGWHRHSHGPPACPARPWPPHKLAILGLTKAGRLWCLPAGSPAAAGHQRLALVARALLPGGANRISPGRPSARGHREERQLLNCGVECTALPSPTPMPALPDHQSEGDI